MNKTQLIEKMAKKSGITKKETAAVVNTMLEIVASALNQGEKVQLIGFGSFEVRQHAARAGKNPRTGEPVQIPASKSAVFKPGKELKDSLNRE